MGPMNALRATGGIERDPTVQSLEEVRASVQLSLREIDLLARKLDLKALELGDVGTAALLGALAGGHTPNLREVILTSNKITDAAMDSFAAAIATGGVMADATAK